MIQAVSDRAAKKKSKAVSLVRKVVTASVSFKESLASPKDDWCRNSRGGWLCGDSPTMLAARRACGGGTRKRAKDLERCIVA